jgi:C-terminal processing protease CtpA/Prc
MPENGTVVPFDSFMTKLYVDASVTFNDTTKLPGEFIIDTGSRHYVKLKQEFVDNRDIKLASTKVTAADFGLSGKAEHSRVTLPEFELGDMRFEHVKTNLIRGGDEDELWIIGSALLNQFISVVDYHSSELQLIPYPDHKFTTRFNLLGLELRKLTTGDFIVQYVMPDLVSKRQGFEVGDLVTQIDGLTAKNIDLDSWLNISATPGKHELCFTRDGAPQCKIVTAEHIQGYSDFN